jgi:hypothetical protein
MMQTVKSFPAHYFFIGVLFAFLGGGGPAIGQDAGSTIPPAERVVFDCTKIYEALNPAIVKILADGGEGSGFLVSSSGFIATNHHVVANSRYLAAQFSDGRKVRAEIIILDPRHDVALLKINRTTVEGIRPLELLPPAEEAVLRAGTPVLAFGSPLSQTFLMTQGIISKVEEGVLLGDFLIQPGNSGGPLVDIQGRVVGINTFAELQISGAVRVGVLRNILTRPEVKSGESVEPSAELLPNLRARRYPPEALKAKILAAKVDTRNYLMDGGKFVITAITPVLIGRLQVQDDLQQAANRMQRRGKKIKDPRYQPVDEPFYEWLRNATAYLDYAVTIEIKPDFGTTAGSKWGAVFGGLAGAEVMQNYEFKAEFEDFRLYRDGVFIPPVKPGRQITEQSLAGYLFKFVDEAYSGMYVYAPDVFLTGREFRMDIFDAREPGKVHKSIKLEADSKWIRQIREDFSNLGE